MGTRFLKHSLVSAFALAGVLALSPVSQALAGDMNVILDKGDTATVQSGDNTIRIGPGGDVVVYTYDKANVDIRPAAGDDPTAAMHIGQMVEGKGIFAGTWTPVDENGVSLGKTFNLYAAPEDIGMLATFNDAAAHVAGLQNWHGHDGFNHNVDGYASCAPLYAALKDGSYNGEWFIPTKEILHGKNVEREKDRGNNLFDQRETMPSGSEFVTVDKGSDTAHWYWSCTEHPGNSSYVYNVRFTDGDGGWIHVDNIELSTRPVRAELRP